MISSTMTVHRERLDRQQATWQALWQHRQPGMLLSAGYPVDGTGIDGIQVTDAAGEPSITMPASQLLPTLDALNHGFDNFPVLSPYVAGDFGAHLVPHLLGAEMRYSAEAHSTFTTWTAPMVASVEEVTALAMPELDTHPYCVALRSAIEAIPKEWQTCFPVQIAGCSPIDGAAAVLGESEFYLGCHTDPESIRYLIDLCTEVTIAVTRLQIHASRRWCGYSAAPGMYVNDLITEFLSPDHWNAFVLPCYRRLAAEFGGLVFGMNSPDPHVLARVVDMEGFLGCAVHRAIPLETVIEHMAGRGVYLLNSYPYRADLDRPACIDGIYYNPIVPYPNADYAEVCRRLADKVALVVNLHRPDRTSAQRDAEALRR
ncbi:MAG: uroporphyrinogen decarboxylase family protein [Armatimonadota bacterium]